MYVTNSMPSAVIHTPASLHYRLTSDTKQKFRPMGIPTKNVDSFFRPSETHKGQNDERHKPK
jgi:hypothetical protein